MTMDTLIAISDSFATIPEALDLIVASQDWRESTWDGPKSLSVKIEDRGGPYPRWVEGGKSVPLNAIFEDSVGYQIQWTKFSRAWDVQAIRPDGSGVADTIFSIPEGCDEHPPQTFVQLVEALSGLYSDGQFTD